MSGRRVAAALCTLVALLPAGAQKGPELSTISLEDLTQMEISVTSFARKDEYLWKTPAAVFVISKEDIARSSADSVPELLRMVPGLQVAQIDASNWAVSARGFNSVYASKLLVLVDGRTVYSEIYSGAHWDQVDPPLETIERIEVIRGPGAAVWGTNAVNGVVNIISKVARGNAGVTGSLGRVHEAATLGYAGVIGSMAEYRVFARYVNRRPFVLFSGETAFDGEQVWSGGGRLDWRVTPADRITTTADLYQGRLKGQILTEVALPVGANGQEDESMGGGHILSRWEHRSGKADRALQVYYDQQTREELASLARTRTLDIDYQDHFEAGSRHDLVWGTEARFTSDHLAGAVLATTKPDYRNYLLDGFLQDEITLKPQRLVLTVGSKVQIGTLAGFQMQPSVRLQWSPSRAETVWGAVSRAAVAPSIQDRDVHIPLVLGVLDGYVLHGELQGDPAFRPETVIAYEAGLRRRMGNTLTVDVAAFLNRNSRIQSLTAGSPAFAEGVPPVAMVPFRYSNGFRATSGGIETSAAWKPFPSLSAQVSYTWMQARTEQVDPGLVAIVDAWNSPRNSLFVTASWSLRKVWSAYGSVQRVGALAPGVQFAVDPVLDYGDVVPAYTRLDLKLSRKLGHGFELQAGGTNLLRPRHLEFGSGTGFVTPSYVPRSLFLKVTWAF